MERNSSNEGHRDYIPANNRKTRRKPLGSFTFEFVGLEFDVFQSTSSFFDRFGGAKTSGSTNYVLFSLHRDFGGVDMSALLHKFTICRFDGEAVICDWIGKKD